MEQFILNFLEGMGNIDFQFVWQIFLYALIVFWVVVLYWVWLDSGERTSNDMSRYLFVILVALLNVIGLIIYLIIRPSQTTEEIYWMDLERRYLKYETSELGDCPKCGTQLYPGFMYCPTCRHRLKTKCVGCGVYIDKKHKYCPHCGQEARKRVAPVETTPSKEVMEKQIQATRNEATEAVETSKTRYIQRGGLALKVGESIVGGYKILGQKAKVLSETVKEKLEKKEEAPIAEQPTKKKKNKKKKKKSKR